MARREVKHLYVDEETGDLILDLGSKSEKGIVLVNGRLPIKDTPHFEQLQTPLPTPGPAYEGIIVTHGHPATHGHPGSKTEVLLCLKNSEGNYEWIEIGEST